MTTREYAKNLFSTWSDDDFCAQPIFDKLLFQVLNGQRTVNTAGVFPINFTRWRKAMRDGQAEPTERDLKAALIRLERRRYVFVDESTGEGLIRSRVRRDELDKQPNVLLSALRLIGTFDSPKFAAVMLGELDRIALPEVKGDSPSANRLRENLKRAEADARTHLARVSEGLSEPFAEPFAEDFPEGLPEPFARPGKTSESGNPSGNPSLNPSVSVSGSVSVSKSPSVGGWVGEVDAEPNETGQTAAAPDRNGPPPERCPKHINDTDPPPCGACRGYRQRRERWDAESGDRAAQARAAFWAAVRACPDCDDRGHIDDETANRVTRCPNHDWENLHA
ncbi:hypothetical protein A5733_11465 [Mycobacterium sp. NS-7484]|uniref:hypothetical protein n=1 Tax=Mycobacterium sp. NS-7484 TaxID=1834161 RepID=UPI00096FDB42|nr:hypothetical protein [Mycobacterium sp. NS-7484]OMB96483.1 hypothetical protein A5733_11465 [Mycobacterium sp. NS-7484]